MTVLLVVLLRAFQTTKYQLEGELAVFVNKAICAQISISPCMCWGSSL